MFDFFGLSCYLFMRIRRRTMKHHVSLTTMKRQADSAAARLQFNFPKMEFHQFLTEA